MVIMAFWPAFFGGFVWDDNRYIVEEEQVRLLQGLVNIWFQPHTLTEAHYWPVLYTSFWLEHKVWGIIECGFRPSCVTAMLETSDSFNPFGYRLLNVLLHIANTVLLWRLLERLAVPGAWLVAALFAVHPVHAEVVAWIITRKDLLATLFCLLAAHCWLQYQQHPRAGTYLGMLLLFAAGVLSKTTAVILPVLLLLQLWWQQGGGVVRATVMPGRRTARGATRAAGMQGRSTVRATTRATGMQGRSTARAATHATGTQGRHTARGATHATAMQGHHSRPSAAAQARAYQQALLRLVPLFVLGLALMALDLQLYHGRSEFTIGYSFAERLIIASKALWFYFGKLLWPQPLLLHYPHWDVSPFIWQNWLAPLAAFGLVLTLWLTRTRLGRGPLVGVLFFIICLAPVLGFTSFGYMDYSFAADRYQYLASAGVLAVLVAAAMTGWQWLGARLIRTPATRGQNSSESGPAPATSGQASGTSSSAPAAKGQASGEFKSAPAAKGQASGEFKSALAAKGQASGEFKSAPATNGQASGEFKSAAAANGQARAKSKAAATSNKAVTPSLAPTTADNNMYRSVLKYCAITLVAALLLVYGQLSYQRAEQFQDEIVLFRHVIAANPEAREVWHTLGVMLMQRERLAEAEEALTEALRQTPNEIKIYANLGNVLMGLDRHAEAVTLMQRGAALVPAEVESLSATAKHHAVAVLLNLGTALGKLGRADAAEAAMRRALAIDEHSSQAQQNLVAMLGERAVVHFNAREFEQALALFERSLTVDPNSAETYSNLGATLAQLGRYRAAISNFQRALELDPQHTTARTNLQLAQQKLNETQ